MEWSPLKIEVLDGDDRKVIQDFVVDLNPEVGISSFKIVVETGFIFNGASVPTFFRGTYLGGRRGTMKASCVHDFGCTYGYLMSTSGTKIMAPRKIIDKIYHRMLLANGVKPIKARAQYLAVRLGAML